MKILSFALLLIGSAAFVLIGCSDNSSSPVGPPSHPNSSSALSKVVPTSRDPITLQGVMRWYVYAKAAHKLIVDPTDTYTLCAAELTFTDQKGFVLHTKESFDNGDGTQTLFREIFFKGTMTPSGQLKYAWPETWLEMNWGTMTVEPAPYPNVIAQIRAHTGYELRGPGVNKNTVNYTGSFDGSKFFADCHTDALQQEPGDMGAPYDVVVAGPIIFSMSIELQVVSP